MSACSIEVGLLRKKPCGHAAVAHCLNCDQPLCTEHAVAQLSEAGQRTGKFLCKDCTAAAKEYAKSMEGVARTQEARKAAALEQSARDYIAHPPDPKKPAAGTPPVPAAAAQPATPATPEPPKKDSGALEFTPSDPKKKP